MRINLATALAVVVSFIIPASATAQTRPNIVVIMVDDLDVGSLGTLVTKGMMPNVKRYLLDVGFNFTNSFVTNALCCPSRATFLTGQYPHNHGVRSNIPPLGSVTQFNELSTVATWMKEAGYRTGYIGKYLNGYGSLKSPYVPPGWDDWRALLDLTTYSMYKYKLFLNGTIIDVGAISDAVGNVPALYQTDVLTLFAADFIAKAPFHLRPFFLAVNPTAPHIELDPIYNECADSADPSPFGGNWWGATVQPAPRHKDTVFGDEVNFALPQRPSFNEADVADKPAWVQSNPELTDTDVACLQKQYWRELESIRAVDDMVGYLFTALQSTNAIGNTVVIFTSDNGLMHGQHRLSQKLAPYEPSIRVPLLIRTPSNSRAVTVPAIVLNNDLAPTIANFGLAARSHIVDGRSLIPLLQNPLQPWRSAFLVEQWHDLEMFGGMTLPPDYAAIRSGGAVPKLFVKYPTVTTGVAGELYDLSVDPDQLENRFGDPSNATLIGQMDPWLSALQACRGLDCAILESYFPY
jgi:N-acetylglucosamine-6-sulfatase